VVEISTKVRTRGPLFDGRASRAAHDYAQQVKEDVADQLYEAVMRNLNSSIRHPTPYYETQITQDPDGDDIVVHDRGIIYGPWLEGTGSRNSPVTRFPGYHSFRRAGEEVNRGAKAIAERILRRFLPRMR
jgi:hypothetical protein